MNVLLDTCALLALARGTLPSGAAGALRTAPEACVSVVAPWEVAIKAAAGKLSLGLAPGAWFAALKARHQLRELPLDSKMVCAAAALPQLHRDPFDRVLVAVALAQSLTILTCDEKIGKYAGITTVW